jgi:metal transporter CNNM
MPLYDILNEFQKGHSHMAVVVREHRDAEQTTNENSIGKHRHALFNYPVIDL